MSLDLPNYPTDVPIRWEKNKKLLNTKDKNKIFVSLSAKPRSNNLYKVNFLCRVYDDFE
jgi:hypothetical protein